MTANYIFSFLISFSILVFANCTGQTKTIKNDSPAIYYMGRVAHTDSSSAFYWPGTSAHINFEGSTVKALLKDDTGNNYYNVIIDNDSVIVVRPSNSKSWITLAEGLDEGTHTLELSKRTEWDHGGTQFFGFKITNGKVLNPRKQKQQKIEFYGNSITAGYGIQDYSGKDRPDSIFTNNYLTYGALTARHFNAEYHCTAKGGIGIMVSWFPQIMPEVYNRINPQDENSFWDFSKYQPQIVVINLFQNDSWIVNIANHESFKQRFGTEKPSESQIIDAYQTFVQSIRNNYPNAAIVCTLGSMDITKEGSLWPSYVSKAVEMLNDTMIYTYYMPYKDTPGHPKVEENEVMAKGLIQFIENNIEW